VRTAWYRRVAVLTAGSQAIVDDGGMRRLRLARTESAWLVAIAAYVLAVAVTHVQRAAPSFSSPRGVLHGQVVGLLTSGLYVVGGPPVDDLAVPALAAALALAALVVGARRTVAAGLLGHVGATLVVYAAIGALWLGGIHVWRSAIDAPDYGVSCVYAAALGLVAAGARAVPLRLLALAAAVATLELGGSLAGWEHFTALLAGVLVGRLAPAPRRAAATPAAARP
jgi:hypothetical protein